MNPKAPNPVNLLEYAKRVEAFRVQVSETKMVVTKPEVSLIVALETALLALPIGLGILTSIAFDARTVVANAVNMADDVLIIKNMMAAALDIDLTKLNDPPPNVVNLRLVPPADEETHPNE